MHPTSDLFFELCILFVGLEVRINHHGDELFEADFGLPTELGGCLGWITDQQIDFGRAIEALVDNDIVLVVEADMTKGYFAEAPDRIGLAG